MITEQDYNDLQNLIRSPGWDMLQEYLTRQIRYLQQDLEQRKFDNLGEVALLQGKVQAYRTILEFPRTRIEGYERKMKGDNNG